MAAQATDYIMISRSGTLYKVTLAELLAYVESQLGTSQFRVADIAARDALNSTLSAGDRVMVDDATGDATVAAGWALYQWLASNTWRKLSEQESLDISVELVTLAGSSATNPLTLTGQALGFSIANLQSAP